MAVRSSMASLITRVRLLINDPVGAAQIFADQDIQDVLDAARLDVKNEALIPKATFNGSAIQFLDYYAHLGDWEDDLVIKQYLVTTVTPATVEPIAGHWQFATSTLPPLYISGKTYDIYRAAADLLERWAARWALCYSFSSDGQSFQRQQAGQALKALSCTYRMQQRARMFTVTRSDLKQSGNMAGAGLGPLEIDYMSDGSGR